VRLDDYLLTYTGLEPIVDNSNAATRVFTGSAANDHIRLKDAPGEGEMTIDAVDGMFESITFPNPTVSLTIDGAAGDDSITIDSLSSAFTPGFNTFVDPELHVRGVADGGTVMVALAGDLNLSNACL